MNIVDLIVGVVILAIIMVASSSFLGYVKDSLVNSENYYEANKFSMATLEELQPLLYDADPELTVNLPNTVHDTALPDCKLRNSYGGGRSYTVTENNWDLLGTYKYKEITVTTSWVYKGQNKSVSLGALKRHEP